MRLFGRFEVSDQTGRVPDPFQGRKVQELFCYLILSKRRPVQRELLAEQLWPKTDSARSKKYLRQALWQLQRAGEMIQIGADHSILEVDNSWISVAPNIGVRVDIEEFDECYEALIKSPQRALCDSMQQRARRAVDLQRGGLLEGWYCDWAIEYQDQYRSMLLVILDRLVVEAEHSGRWELGLSYGRRALQVDRANERIHVGMMRLHCLAGNRTAALRQFDRCTRALHEELAVKPSRGTRELDALIRSDTYGEPTSLAAALTSDSGRVGATESPQPLTLIGQLRQLNRSLTNLTDQMADHIEEIER